jgi:selenide,water dikinase
MQLNNVGELLGKMAGVHAMTDVTGFGLLGHLVEMADGSGLSAVIDFDTVPLITDDLKNYVGQKCVPGGTDRNWDSYGDKIGDINDYQKAILADPQTSGGLLIAVEENSVEKVKQILSGDGIEFIKPIGRFIKAEEKIIMVN